MSYFGVSVRNGAGLGLGTVPSLVSTPLSYRLAPALNLEFAGAQSLDPRITFTRSTTATYYNSAGVLTTTGFNLLTYSEQFDNAAWVKAAVTVTANTDIAPDGTLTADKVIPVVTSTTFKELQQNVSIAASTSYTFSCYVKSAGYQYIQIIGTGAVFGTFSVNYDLSSGVETAFAAGTSTITARTITSEGNGWYRVSVTAVSLSAASGRIAINVIPAANSVRGVTWASDGTSGVLQWGAQLETGSTATVYIPTTSATSGAPRFDYNPSTLAPLGLLIEESRTNLLTYSEQFDNAAWAKTQSSITADATTSPDGTVDADKLVEDSANSTHFITAPSVSVTSGAAYTISVYAKEVVGSAKRYLTLLFPSAQFGVNFRATFDLSAGTFTSVNSPTAVSITNVGNGFYRCSMTASATSTAATNPQIRLFNAATDTLGIYQGDGTSGIYIWGAQLEAGAFATSYIPTVASQVTRAADVATMTGTNFSSWYNATEGSIYAKADSVRPVGLSPNTRVFQFDDGTVNNNIRSASVATLQVINATAVQANLSPSPTITFDGTVFAFASAYKLNDFASSTGGAVLTDTVGTVPSVNQLSLGGGVGAGILNGHIQRLAYYNRRLSNAELQGITR